MLSVSPPLPHRARISFQFLAPHVLAEVDRMFSLVLPQPLDPADILIDAALELEDERLPALARPQVLEHLRPVPFVQEVPEDEELLFLRRERPVKSQMWIHVGPLRDHPFFGRTSSVSFFDQPVPCFTR